MQKKHFRKFKMIISAINILTFLKKIKIPCLCSQFCFNMLFVLKETDNSIPLKINTGDYKLLLIRSQDGNILFHNMLQIFLLDVFLPPSPSSSPSFKTIMQICFLSWRVLENFRLHFLHSKLPGETSDSSSPSSVPGRVSSLWTGLFSATSSSTQNFLVDPFGLPLFLFTTRSSRKES